jgi:O-antigen ligase
MRYPVFLLVFGPPIFRPNVGVDATKGVVDIWGLIQVCLLGAIAFPAIYRLASAESILIPKQIRSIFKLVFLLGLLFLASAIYSPSHLVSAAYAIFNILTWICMGEFVAKVYQDPPDWIQCLFYLRLIGLLLLALALLTILFAPSLIVSIDDVQGVRLRGGAVAPVVAICPIIAIISAYSFLHRLEPRGRSALLFFVGLTSTLSTQSRGAELALFSSLAIIGAGWAKRGKRPAYLFISGLMASILLFGLTLGAIGGSRVWSVLNRGESVEGIASASGRTYVWNFVFRYCMEHPQGMGYIAGIRTRLRENIASGQYPDLIYLGNAHNIYMEVLADAGWVALALYLLLMAKVVALGWRFATARNDLRIAPDDPTRHALRCAIVMLVSCFVGGMNTAEFIVPLRSMFYWQAVIVAIILGISARMLHASRGMGLDTTR